MTDMTQTMQALHAAIHADPEYAWSWHCNLAVPIMDAAGTSHKDANRAAALIMAQVFGYDITTHPHFVWGKSTQQEYFEARCEADREDSAHD